MKKILIILLFVTVTTLMISPASAWSVPTHYAIAEKTYYALPADVQSKLSLNIMKDGADDPDLKFLDFQYHKYPNNKVKIDYWLNRGKEDYQNGNYNDASYSFGVASHYIADGCCAPHCEDNSSHGYHLLYELKAIILSPQINSSSGNLDALLDNDAIDGKESYDSWINNENDFYIQNDLDRAGNACYTAIMDSVS